jgi:hypothetical protein
MYCIVWAFCLEDELKDLMAILKGLMRRWFGRGSVNRKLPYVPLFQYNGISY